MRNILFDLDNTLYPPGSAMDRMILERMVGFTARFFGISFAEALSLRAERLKKHVSTLEWLKAGGITEEGIEEYFAAVHPEDEAEVLSPDPTLRPLLESLPQGKVILTNAPSEHAEHVLSFLGVRDLFHPVISDIRANGLLGKPFEVAYRNALSLAGGSVSDTLFIDDYPPYALGYARLGGTALVVGGADVPGVEGLPGRVAAIGSIRELPDFLEKNENFF